MPESLESLKNGGAHYVNEPVVQDGFVVTADGPEACQSIGEAVVEVLASVSASK